MASTLLKRENFELEIGFTDCYKTYEHSHPAIREARCLEYQIPRILLDIQEDDLIPGGCHYGAIGFSTQIGGFLYYMHEEKLTAEMEEHCHNLSYIIKLRTLQNFWQTRTSTPQLRASYSSSQQIALPTDDWENTSAIAYPLYRMAGAILDFEKLLALGLTGMEALIDHKKTICSKEKQPLYEGMSIALGTLRKVITLYKDRAEELSLSLNDTKHQQNMKELHQSLDAILTAPPTHLLDAILLFWMYVIVSEVRNYGRIDTYLGDFYSQDIENGHLSQEKADYYIEKLWERMAKRGTITDGRVFIGGLGRKNEASADQLALSCIRATKKLRNPDPQLSLRFYKGMNPALYDAAMEAISMGCTYPILYNDDVIVSDVEKAFLLPYEVAVHYVPYGCGEYIIDHQSFGTPSGVLNLLKALEVTLTGGKDLYDGKQLGITTKSLMDYETFEELYTAYKEQLTFHVEALALQEKQAYDYAGSVACFPYLSMLYDDCIEKGASIFGGGIRYLGGTLECYGNINSADSLYALKTLIFDQQLCSKSELLEALQSNFVNYPLLKKQLTQCTKFGNDDNLCDEMATSLHNFVCNTIRSQGEKNGLHSYLAVIINNSANTSLGLLTGASCDGRLKCKPMANAINPQAGGDKNGITALLNSMLKLDTHIHGGAVYNIKISKETMKDYAANIYQLVDAYFKQGGAQLMITVVGKEDLLLAQKNPKDYPNLLVRVGGFSARFVTLAPSVQEEIISRTCY